MPEFILDHGSPEGARAFQKLDAFTQGYVEAMFFTDTGYSENADLEHASLAELAPEAFERIKADCAKFLAIFDPLADKVADEMSEAGDTFCWEHEAAGRDFWFTRNGDGAGFWDGDWPEPHATALTEAAHQFGPCDMYRGDDGRIYLA